MLMIFSAPNVSFYSCYLSLMPKDHTVVTTHLAIPLTLTTASFLWLLIAKHSLEKSFSASAFAVCQKRSCTSCNDKPLWADSQSRSSHKLSSSSICLCFPAYKATQKKKKKIIPSKQYDRLEVNMQKYKELKFKTDVEKGEAKGAVVWNRGVCILLN